MDPDLPLAGVTPRAPIRRGELPVIVKENAPGQIVIVDGLFHTEIAVGHLEIRSALGRGWTVWGLSSMGAIRAREMSTLGMRGYGDVYAMYCQEGVDFRDDEVTLMHGSAPDYVELSEPLVHIRAATADLVADGTLGAEQRAAVIQELEAMWYADRTLAWLATRLRQLAPDRDQRLSEFLTGFDRYRLKSLDLIRFLRSGVLG